MNHNPKFHLWSRTISLLIDIMFVLSITHLSYLLILQFFDVNFLTLLFIEFPSYYLICYWFLEGRTLAKIITGIQVASKKSGELARLQIIMREVAGKFIILLIIPFYLIKEIAFPIKPVLLFGGIGYILFIVIISIVFPSFFKITWWELISSTKTIRSKVTNSTWKVKSVIILTCIYSITIILKIYPFLVHPQKIKYEFHPEYSNNFKIKEYTDYILSNSQDQVDYIFGLFEKYDLVVLCERMHSEYTQYELISKIISDKRFPGTVGNLYTECGSSSYQDELNEYLNTKFINEDSLDKATAYLQRNSNAIWPLWTNTNLFDLLKHVNTLNNGLADSLKINWYFTDLPVNWSEMSPLVYRKQTRRKRDEEMASRIITEYKEKIIKKKHRRKGLVVMNFRHAYGLIRDDMGNKIDHPFNSNTAAILMDTFPEKVCNIMINTISFKLGLIFTPIQNGKWDKAFSLLGNPNVGFDFENSPFGQDKFDAFIGNSARGLRYTDVFTGFVFCNPLEKHFHKTGFPYMLDNFEDTLINRAKSVNLAYSEKWKISIENYKRNETCKGYIKHASLVNLCNGSIEYATLYNTIVNIGFSIVAFLTMIITLFIYKI